MGMVIGKAASCHPQQLPLVQRCCRVIDPGAPRPQQAACLQRRHSACQPLMTHMLFLHSMQASIISLPFCSVHSSSVPSCHSQYFAFEDCVMETCIAKVYFTCASCHQVVKARLWQPSRCQPAATCCRWRFCCRSAACSFHCCITQKSCLLRSRAIAPVAVLLAISACIIMCIHSVQE